MSREYRLDSCRLCLRRQGSTTYVKTSYPQRCGVYAELATASFTFHFNLNGEIIRAAGSGPDWPHPHEWLKRTVGNDWIYYSTGGYTGVFETTGEYYLPNLPYPTNRSMGGSPLSSPVVSHLTGNWHRLLSELSDQLHEPPEEVEAFFAAILAQSPEKLALKARTLASIVGGRVSVLPPDTRHVDYNVIPLTIARGCLYKCHFCRVKNEQPFSELSRGEISEQIDRLQALYGADLANYNALFLGEHDALMAAPELIIASISEAVEKLALHHSHIRGCNIFLFGSVGSLLAAPDELFRQLNGLPATTYINIGLESADQQTLERLGKPLKAGEVVAAFERLLYINSCCEAVEITANFVMDETLPPQHTERLLDLVRDRVARPQTKGCIYLSPLSFEAPSRARLFEFYRLKVLSRLPLHLYVIQRL